MPQEKPREIGEDPQKNHSLQENGTNTDEDDRKAKEEKKQALGVLREELKKILPRIEDIPQDGKIKEFAEPLTEKNTEQKNERIQEAFFSLMKVRGVNTANIDGINISVTDYFIEMIRRDLSEEEVEGLLVFTTAVAEQKSEKNTKAVRYDLYRCGRIIRSCRVILGIEEKKDAEFVPALRMLLEEKIEEAKKITDIQDKMRAFHELSLELLEYREIAEDSTYEYAKKALKAIEEEIYSLSRDDLLSVTDSLLEENQTLSEKRLISQDNAVRSVVLWRALLGREKGNEFFDNCLKENNELILPSQNGEDEWLWRIRSRKMNGERVFIFRRKDNEKVVLIVEAENLAQAIHRNTLGELLLRANAHAQVEKEGNEQRRNFDLTNDLPEEGKILHLKFMNATDGDEVSRSTFTTLCMKSAALKAHYGGDKCICPPVIFAKDLIASLEKRLDAVNRQPQHILIDISTHGNEEGIVFNGQPIDGQTLLKAILAHAPSDAKITLQTDACNGGNLINDYMHLQRKFPQYKNRIVIVTEAKPDTKNFSGQFQGEREVVPMGTHFGLKLLKGILQGETYGEAIHNADVETKTDIGNDAETVINGQIITKNDGSQLEKTAASA